LANITAINFVFNSEKTGTSTSITTAGAATSGTSSAGGRTGSGLTSSTQPSTSGPGSTLFTQNILLFITEGKATSFHHVMTSKNGSGESLINGEFD
jgi:hypothetical protein